MFCTQCGTRNPENARYCKQCGRPIEAAPPEQPPAAPQPAALADRARQLRERAERRLAAGELDAALDDAREAAEIAPDEPEVHRLLARVHERRGEMGLAVASAERVCELLPDGLDDRDRLVALKHGRPAAPRRFFGKRPGAQAVLFDSPSGAVLAAVVAFVVVGLAVAGLLRLLEGRPDEPAGRPATPPALPAALAPPGAPQPAAAPPVVVNPGVTVNPQGAAQPAAAPGWNAGAGSPNGANTPGMAPPRPVGLAPVSASPRAALENDPRFFPQPQRDPPTVHLPDTGDSQRSGAGSGSGAGAANASSAAGPGEARPDPGRMEIVIAPGSGATNTAGTPAGPRNHRQVGQQLQLQGEYRQAIAEYLRALDGATEGVGDLHQRIALCYQRLGEKDAAARHYSEAVVAYQAQIASGKNVEVARQGVRACELGLRALQ